MSITPYQLGYPPDGSSLGQTKTVIRGNLDGTFLTLAVDHINNNGQPGMQPAGYHKAIHMVQQTPPTAVPNVGELWCTTANDGYSSDTIFFQKTGLNLNTQLSRNFAPSAATNGYTFIPGGLVLQWGLVNGTHGVDNHFNGGDTGAVTFSSANIIFPANCFTVWTQPMYTTGNTPSSNGPCTIAIASNYTNTSFTWFIASPSSAYTRFFWFAIGN